ncbi:uncharacterized protein [Euwallacea fornicatus]|uniref:uncharacterized protein isoform X2 n=1 Tax=Euwallacea fornicatus TaxID=995702 RepID=UPI00338F0ACD
MTRANEVPVVSTVLSVYKRLVTYRPHLTEESRRNLVQKKLLEDYQIKLSLEEISVIIKSHPEIIPARKPVLVKRDRNQEVWHKKSSPIERKRDFRKITDENFPTIQPSRPVEDTKVPFNFDFTNSNSVQSRSRIPKPIFRFGKHVDVDNKQHPNIYDRLYQQRSLPCEHKVERVHFIRDIWTAKASQHKPPQKPQPCAFHEPPEKKFRYSKQCLDGALSTSVFDRLYAQRKQLNTKKLTDVQERQLYLRQQKQEHLQMQRRRVQSLSAEKCGRFPVRKCEASSTTSEGNFCF